jgi:hypothetical protein
MLIFHMSVLAPWVVAADLGSAPGVPSPCAGAAHHDASEPCPGCPDLRCSSSDCLSLCVAVAVVPVVPPVVVSTATNESPATAIVPSPADRTQPPLHPPPIR